RPVHEPRQALARELLVLDHQYAESLHADCSTADASAGRMIEARKRLRDTNPASSRAAGPYISASRRRLFGIVSCVPSAGSGICSAGSQELLMSMTMSPASRRGCTWISPPFAQRATL